MNKELPVRAKVLETLHGLWKAQPQVETVEIDDALGRVLAQDAVSLVTVPVVRASRMDGVGVQSALFAEGMPDTGGWMQGRDYCRADTGDDFDDRFDAVIPIERVALSQDGHIAIDPEVRVEPGMNLRPRGSVIAEGDLLVPKNRLLRSFDLACLAVGGATCASVYKRPRVAYIPTGSELVPLGVTPGRGETVDSNTTLVKHMLCEMGAEPVCLPIVRDEKQALERALLQALQLADIVVLNGGTSKGAEDFNAALLEERGEALFHWVAAAPGMPMCVAMVEGKPVINIPGPPAATLYGMDWCVRSLVYRLLERPMPKRQTIRGTLTEEIVAPSSREILCLMEVERTDAGYNVKQKPWRGGGTTANSLGAGALFITRLGEGTYAQGELLEVELLRGEEEY